MSTDLRQSGEGLIENGDRTNRPTDHNDKPPDASAYDALAAAIKVLETRLAALEKLQAGVGTSPGHTSMDDSDLLTVRGRSLPGDDQNVKTEIKADMTTDSDETASRIRYVQKITDDMGTTEKPGRNPLDHKSDEDKCPTPWLTVVENVNSEKDAGPNRITWEITICDVNLRDCITKVLASYIDHTSKQVWQGTEVTLSNLITPILNYRRLESEKSSPSLSPITRERLGELLEIIKAVSDPLLLRAPEPTGKIRDFRIQYYHLWTLFRPGNLIVSSWDQADGPQVFRVDKFSCNKIESHFDIIAWVWDWDGQKIIRTLFEFRIEHYSEDKSPTELTCYPIEFYEDEEGRRGKAAIHAAQMYRKRRELFLQYTYQQKDSPSVLRYSGDVFRGASAFQPDPLLRLLCEMSGLRVLRKGRARLDKIDEDIILDTENYMRKGGGSRWIGNIEPTNDTKLCHCSLCLEEETKAWKDAIEHGRDFPLHDNDLLLPPRLFGFALNRKDWCQFYLNNIKMVDLLEATPDEGEVKGLILPSDVDKKERQDIYKMVRNHWEMMTKAPAERIADMIGGKGESLILLFHGYSGTGKTLYAESLAKSTGRPLFKVGTSDIGLDAPQAERNLKDIFELAETWNAVLLIDDADVLLDARGKENDSLVSKNALVSVLLREVEYFKGVLIMTTNRVVAFDPAILTRIHHSVNFGEPDVAQESAIWDIWLDRLKKKNLCAKPHELEDWVKETTGSRKRAVLSGREIRNIFIVAQTLAGTEGQDVKIARHHLDAAYKYKNDFRKDTEHQRIQSKNLLAHRPAHN